MPYADQSTIDNANNILATGSIAQIKTLLNSNPVLPPSGGINFQTVKPDAKKFEDVVKLDYSKLKIGAASDSIAFIKFLANMKNEIGAITFVVKTPSELPSTDSRKGWIAIWWLPWQQKHIVKIKILSNATNPTINCGKGIDPVANPHLFFTAAINGCSVFAVGDARNPSMYHGGSDGPMTARTDTELTEAAWRRLLGRATSTKNIKGIGKTDYISEMKPQSQWADPNQAHDKTDRTAFETTASRGFEAELQRRGGLSVSLVQPWGMVFGVRDAANNWEMTLVKNVMLKYRKLSVKKRFLRKDLVKRIGETRTEVKYDREGQAYDPQVLTDVDIQNCHTLGYQVFYPGQGAAQMYDLRAINIY
jgi:hypothetical protein